MNSAAFATITVRKETIHEYSIENFATSIKIQISIILGDSDMALVIFSTGYIYSYNGMHVVDLNIDRSFVKPGGVLCNRNLAKLLNVDSVEIPSCLNATSPNPPTPKSDSINVVFLVVVIIVGIVLISGCLLVYYLRNTRSRR